MAGWEVLSRVKHLRRELERPAEMNKRLSSVHQQACISADTQGGILTARSARCLVGSWAGGGQGWLTRRRRKPAMEFVWLLCTVIVSSPVEGSITRESCVLVALVGMSPN